MFYNDFVKGATEERNTTSIRHCSVSLAFLEEEVFSLERILDLFAFHNVSLRPADDRNKAQFQRIHLAS